MEEKEIDINNEEQILKNCGIFNYFYNCEEWSRELCMFYNDIIKQKNNFNTRQALIDLGRIAITLNQQPKRIKELENENKQLKQQLHDLPKKIVEEIRDCVSKRIMEKEVKWGDNIQIVFICNAINECLYFIFFFFLVEDEK